MANKIFFLTCPDCRERFYITEEFAGQGYDWCCPFCQRTFKEHESLEQHQLIPNAPRQSTQGHKM